MVNISRELASDLDLWMGGRLVVGPVDDMELSDPRLAVSCLLVVVVVVAVKVAVLHLEGEYALQTDGVCV